MLKEKKANFITNIIDNDFKEKKIDELITRFPPEPNGYLHIGHAKAICLNFGLAKIYNGKCNLRFDDTNPEKENMDYVNAIKDDIKWLGFDFVENLHFTSDYFEDFYECALILIKKGLAYVCDLSYLEMKEHRGTLSQAGKNSPYRNRSIEENLILFQKMKNGDFKEGEKVLRAKIDMNSGNINLRDPVLYRIKFANHHRTKNKWCIYPMYDFAHTISDAIENISHSLCSLEFQDHKPLYDWIIDNTEICTNKKNRPYQYEFSRLNLTYTITSKRKLKFLIDNNIVNSWCDPRLPTLKGVRRLGFTANSIKNFCQEIGVSKQDSIIDFEILENFVRDDLNKICLRKNVVLDPLKITITNLENDFIENISVPNHPQNEDLLRRNVSFSNQIYIEKEDFKESANKKFKRLVLGKRARLMNAYVIECNEVIKDEQGNILELKCKYFKETFQGKKPIDGIKEKGIIHWVDAKNCLDLKINVYDKIFNNKECGNIDFLENINKNSYKQINAKSETSLLESKKEDKFQFNRVGYFVADMNNFSQNNLEFNKIINLRSTF